MLHKNGEAVKGKSLSLKRPLVTLSDQENSKKANKAVDRPQVTSSNQENGEKSIEDNRQRATSFYHKNSKKGDKTDERYLFDVTFDDLNKFKEGECPANTEKNTEWAIRNLSPGNRLEIEGIQKSSACLMYCSKLIITSCVIGYANIYIRHAR